MISLLSFGPEGWGRLILSATLTTLLLSFAALLVGACVSAACVILLKAFAKKKPTNVATDDELDLDFEIN